MIGDTHKPGDLFLIFDDVAGPLHLPTLIGDAFGVSRSDGRRMIAQGAVRLDGRTVVEVDLPPARLDGRVLHLGQRSRHLKLVVSTRDVEQASPVERAKDSRT